MFRSILRSIISHKYSTEHMNPNTIQTEYYIRPEILKKAQTIAASHSKPDLLDPLIQFGTSDPHKDGQKPLTWLRQVLSLLIHPDEVDNKVIRKLYNEDVVEKANYIKENFEGGLGSYAPDKGEPLIRKSIVRYIEKRDGHSADYELIYTSNGASYARDFILTAAVKSPKDAVLIPVPEYPFYNSFINIRGGTPLKYDLEYSNKKWKLNLEEVQKTLDRGKEEGLQCKTMVVINPGNPTGNLLTYSEMLEILDFCRVNELAVLADEVYEENIIKGEFHSFRKVILDSKSKVECASVHSLSKGLYGECGIRAGFLDLLNFEKGPLKVILEICCMKASNSIGEAAYEVLLNPPEPHQQSYNLYKKEIEEIQNGFLRKAEFVSQKLSEMMSVECNIIEGSVYAFPEIKFSNRAIEAAREENMSPDEFYCMQALEKTGIVLIPGSAFGLSSYPTHFFRLSLLFPDIELKEILNKLQIFNQSFHTNYHEYIETPEYIHA